MAVCALISFSVPIEQAKAFPSVVNEHAGFAIYRGPFAEVSPYLPSSDVAALWGPHAHPGNHNSQSHWEMACRHLKTWP